MSINSGSKSLIFGIDATNLRGGGGVTHLVELLRFAQPQLQMYWPHQQQAYLLSLRSKPSR